ncbi:hypothetical protein Csa_001116 [Cucumis sativus]|uniref:Uncharacterized protein n=1 Tax=Cucumis sativus TaxID=3659 RepID=A0A0A0LIF7_CUCSA|nr:hypothetical protein Csa_001116 [Cucumis sativus]
MFTLQHSPIRRAPRGIHSPLPITLTGLARESLTALRSPSTHITVTDLPHQTTAFLAADVLGFPATSPGSCRTFRTS